MLGIAAAFLLFFLPSQVNGFTTSAKCAAGFDWMFSSVGESPCDMAAELSTVCAGTRVDVEPLPVGYFYVGPTKAVANECRCSSVVYSLISGCGYCQNRPYIYWSDFRYNCTSVSLSTFPRDIPIGVKVPAYAYQDVSVSDIFNVTLAQSMIGRVESTRVAPTSTSTSATSSSLLSTSSVPSTPSTGTSSTSNKTPAIVGGVVGGLLGLAVIITTFVLLRSKQKHARSQSLGSDSPEKAILSPNTTDSLTPATMSLPNSPAKFDSAADHTSSMFDPYRQNSPPLNPNMPPNYGNNYILPQTTPQNMGVSTKYSGWPEL